MGHLLTPPRRRLSRAQLILPTLCAGLLVACGFVLLRSSRVSHTISQVRREIHGIALARAESTEIDDGGLVGPWWIAADTVDPATGMLERFRVTSGRMEIAAGTARLVVDPHGDTFSFELHDVAFTRVPARQDDDLAKAEPDHFLLSQESYVLGPAPWGLDIVSDAP